MSIATINRTPLHYEVLGRGQPVILLHGWAGSWRYWWPTMQGLSAQYRSFALDLWGFGDSANASQLYSLSDYTDLVADFIDELAIVTPVALVGHALGAAVALRFASQRPHAVNRLVCTALPVVQAASNTPFTRLKPTALLKKLLGKGTPFAEISTEIHKTDQKALARLLREVQQHNWAGELAKIPIPTLSIYGKRDPVTTPPEVKLPTATTPDLYRQIVLDECAHFPMLEEPAVFTRLLLDFLLNEDSNPKITPKAYWQRRVR